MLAQLLQARFRVGRLFHRITAFCQSLAKDETGCFFVINNQNRWLHRTMLSAGMGEVEADFPGSSTRNNVPLAGSLST